MGRTSIYCVYKVSHIDLSDKELKHLNDQEQCNLLNDNQIFVAEPFSINFKYFSKKSYLTVHWEKQNIMLFVLNFKSGVAYMSIHL